MAIKTRLSSVKRHKKVKEVVPKHDLCVLCCKLSDDCYMGKLLTSHTMIVHENCLLFSPILKQVQDPDIEQKGFIIGFKISDVEKEVRRIGRLRCSVCRCIRAGVGCCNVACRKSFHLSCGLNSNAVGIFKDCFQFYCSYHASSQKLKKQFASCDQTVPDCTICLESLIEEADDESKQGTAKENLWTQFVTKVQERAIIHGLCCSRCWMHRICMRQYGLSAGLHHVKCPHCGDKATFIDSVQDCGIWLPDRDASWELEPGAYQELYNGTDEDIVAEPCVDTDMPNSNHNRAEASECNIENKCVDTDARYGHEISNGVDEVAVASKTEAELNNSDRFQIVDPTDVTVCVRSSPPTLRKRNRPSDWSSKSTPPKATKRRRTSKGSVKAGILVQKQCARCCKKIMSFGCYQTSVLAEVNHTNQGNDRGVTAPNRNTHLEYVCVSCHK